MSNREDDGDVTLRNMIMPDDSLVEAVLAALSPVNSGVVKVALEEIDLLVQLRESMGPADKMRLADELCCSKLLGFALCRLFIHAGYENATRLLPRFKDLLDDMAANSRPLRS